MSMPFVIKQTCFVCGKESSVTVMASTNTLGGTPDLDLRPAEMMRSTMPRWIQECPHCGYIAGSLDKETTVTQKWLKGMHFISCGDRWFRSDLAEKFYKYYLICMEDKCVKDAFYAALYTAWVCDDKGDAENAGHCRRCALAELEKLLAEPNPPADLFAVKADLLRRTGQFDALIAEYEGKRFENDLLNQVIAFQIEKAKQQDTRCYRVGDVTGTERR